MRSFKLFMFGFLFLATVSSCCKKDEPVVPVEPSVEIPVAYYFAGEVKEGTTPLTGVDVLVNGNKAATTDAKGQYTASVESKAVYSIEFRKDGYISQSVTRDASTMADNQTTIISPKLFKLPAAIIATGEEQKLSTGAPTASSPVQLDITIPKGAAAAGTKIYVTSYAPVANGTMPSLIGLYLHPFNISFAATPVFIKSSLPKGYSYGSIIAANIAPTKNLVDSKPEFNPATNTYALTINSFSNYTLDADVKVTYGTPVVSTKIFENIVVNDACGANQPIKYTQTVSERTGYVYTTPVETLVATALPALSAADKATITASLKAKVTGMLGDEGVRTVKVSKGVATIAPNTLYNYVSYAVDRTIRADFEIVDPSGNAVVIPVEVKQATGVSSSVKALSCSDHSGGGSHSGGGTN
ncbi:MAG: hypothetical protein ACRCX4_05965 [Bacteroidales bacterium]